MAAKRLSKRGHIPSSWTRIRQKDASCLKKKTLYFPGNAFGLIWPPFISTLLTFYSLVHPVDIILTVTSSYCCIVSFLALVTHRHAVSGCDDGIFEDLPCLWMCRFLSSSPCQMEGSGSPRVRRLHFPVGLWINSPRKHFAKLGRRWPSAVSVKWVEWSFFIGLSFVHHHLPLTKFSQMWPIRWAGTLLLFFFKPFLRFRYRLSLLNLSKRRKVNPTVDSSPANRRAHRTNPHHGTPPKENIRRTLHLHRNNDCLVSFDSQNVRESVWKL